MIKKRGTKKVIESTSRPYVEHSFIKYPTQEPIDVSTSLSGYSTSVRNPFKLFKLRKDPRKYTGIHTHPSNFFNSSYVPIGGTEVKTVATIPSGTDFENFFEEDKQKTMAIAVREPETGEVLGYNVIRKTKQTPKINPEFNWKGSPLKVLVSRFKYEWDSLKIKGRLLQDIRSYNRIARRNVIDSPETTVKSYDELMAKYHLQSKLVPARGYEVNNIRSNFQKKGLEKAAATASIVGILAGLFFLSPNITGNAIAGMNFTNSSLIGAGLMLVGLLAGYFYVKKK